MSDCLTWETRQRPDRGSCRTLTCRAFHNWSFVPAKENYELEDRAHLGEVDAMLGPCGACELTKILPVFAQAFSSQS